MCIWYFNLINRYKTTVLPTGAIVNHRDDMTTNRRLRWSHKPVSMVFPGASIHLCPLILIPKRKLINYKSVTCYNFVAHHSRAMSARKYQSLPHQQNKIQIKGCVSQTLGYRSFLDYNSTNPSNAISS